eukprot:TRINITY_DN95572_c0_g1_i1.p1 TRINITY_DN95572_c0_g1~~TRINITY_DN95572_c0_g1_i1.p1  ORF type:complete len:504 (+),score=134.34 TRINITY_DN95572_c0_g1_i1:137-1513(+)
MALASSYQESGISASSSLAEACAAADWALFAHQSLNAMSLPKSDAMTGDTDPDLEGALALMDESRKMSREEAMTLVLDSLRSSLSEHQLHHCRVLQAARPGKPPLCVLPRQGGRAQSSAAAKVDGLSLLSSAELLMAEQAEKADVALAAALFDAVCNSTNKVKAWQPEHQVRWLTVATSAMEASVVIQSDSIVPLLNSLASLKSGQFVPPAAALASVLPRTLQAAGPDIANEISRVGSALCESLKPELFRLRLWEARESLGGSLLLCQKLPKECGGDTMKPLANNLLTATLEGLSAKFKAECVFHRRGGEGPGGPEVASWCTLLANQELLGKDAPEDVWEHLAGEAIRSLAASGLGHDDRGLSSHEDMMGFTSGAAIAADMLEAFGSVGKRKGWNVEDSDSPLGRLIQAVDAEWRRSVAVDGEKEDPIHEPAAVPTEDGLHLQRLFEEIAGRRLQGSR